MYANLFSANAITKFINVTSNASPSGPLPDTGNSLRLVNLGPNTVFLSVGMGVQVATVPSSAGANTSTPVLHGSDIVLSVPQSSVQNISVVCNSGETAHLLVAVGEGQ